MAAIVTDEHEQQQQQQAGMVAAAMESSMQAAMRDGNLVSRIVSRLLCAADRLSATLVCSIWNDAVVFESNRLSIRSRSFLPRLALRFSHICILDFGHCFDQLYNHDLAIAASSFARLQTLIIGHPDLPQDFITDDGLHSFASNCPLLEHVVLSCLPNLMSSGISYLVEGCMLLRSISLENCHSLTDAALEAISKCRNLEELTLKGSFKFSPEGLAVIGKRCRSLLRIRLEFRSLDVSFALKSLAVGCLNIQEISLKVRNVDLGDIIKCTTLTCLRVETDQWSFMDGVVIGIAAANKNLKELVFINHYAPLSDAAVVGIVQNCRNLEKLRIDAVRLTEAALQCLMDCKTLKCLALDHFQSAGQGLAEVGLCGLDLNDFSLKSGSGIRDVELQTLVQGNRQLEHLDLQCCHGPSPIGFSAIGNCSNLQSLNLSFTAVDNLSLMAIADGTRSLRRLSLVKCESVTDIGMISRFTALESLNLDQCPFVNDKGLDEVAVGCSQLAHLNLAFTQTTDKGLFHLTRCSQLRSLRVPYCKGVEGPGLIAIANACTWFQYLVLSHRFRDSKTLDELRKHCCMVRLEMDDMALVPFGFNLLM